MYALDYGSQGCLALQEQSCRGKSGLALLRSTKSQSDRKEREGDMVSGGHGHLWEGDIAGECRKTL